MTPRVLCYVSKQTDLINLYAIKVQGKLTIRIRPQGPNHMPAVLPMASFLITWAQEIRADLESQEAGSVNKVFAMQV